MSFKIDSLFPKIYSNFIKGVYGSPKIPSKNEVIKKIEEITNEEYIPIYNHKNMDNIDINNISNSYNSIIDDLDVLFHSIELESLEVSNQLKSSLGEHRGAKRELRKINTQTQDIMDGKLGEEYLKYNFTENFDDLKNINTLKSDPINTDIGVFTIQENSGNNLTLYHYSGTKLDFNILENYSEILENDYVGITDAITILDPEDPRQIVYRIKTKKATRLRVATSIQLSADGSPVDISSVTLDIDSEMSKGFIKLFIRDGFKWKDEQTGIVNIKNDKIQFSFPPEKATHLKIEFIKDSPDITSTNEYFFIINNIAISLSKSQRHATLYSKPISFQPYSDEVPVVSDVSASGDFYIPKDCSVKLFVAPDIKVNGAFLDSLSNIVDPSSTSAVEFDPLVDSSVFLSDLWNVNESISGVSLYKSLDFNWQELGLTSASNVPKVVDFNNTLKKELIENSFYNTGNTILFNDQTSIFDPTLYYGWINTSNPNWSLLEPYVSSGIFISGPNLAAKHSINYNEIQDISGSMHPLIASDPEWSGQWLGYSGVGVGYEFGHINNSNNIIRFGDYSQIINGWWRPSSHFISSSGVIPDAIYSGYPNNINPSVTDNTADFYFNGIKFYKIYKFGNLSTVLDASVKLYTYQEQPMSVSDGYYPHHFTWQYKSGWKYDIGVNKNQIDENSPLTFSGYIIPITNLNINEEYVFDSISEIKISNTSTILNRDEYVIKYDSLTSNITGIDLTPLLITRPHMTPEGISFDYKFQYKIKNRYLSTWSSYVIISEGSLDPFVSIKNSKVTLTDITGSVYMNKEVDIISKVTIEDLDSKIITDISIDQNVFNVFFKSSSTSIGNRHFRIVIYTLSDERTGFSATTSTNNGDLKPWIPYEKSGDESTNYNLTNIGPLSASSGIKFVSRLNPITVVDMSKLIYDTPINYENRAGIFTDFNNEKYLVVKIPSKDIFPGYYFNVLKKQYENSEITKISNLGHWVRKEINKNSNDVITYTTGSNGDIIEYPNFTIDKTWNNGNTLASFPNTNLNIRYKNHSTYGKNINIDHDATNPETKFGFLFYDSAENLPTFYSIFYKILDETTTINNKFLYKIELESNDTNSLKPVVKSLRFEVNREVDNAK